MNYKLYATLCDQPLTIFFPSGFYRHETTPTPLHRHYYAEMHVVYAGSIDYSIGDKKYRLEAGSFLAIPPHVQHTCVTVSEDTLHSSFLFDHAIPSVLCGSLPREITDGMLLEIGRATENNNYFALSGYISLLLSRVCTDAVVRVKEMRDDALMIDNYIEKHYANSPNLAELAEELKLSEKQTARLVKSYTGLTFSDMITQKRMKTADILRRTTDMSLKEISEYVGYSSYSGFYKAFRRAFDGKDEQVDK